MQSPEPRVHAKQKQKQKRQQQLTNKQLLLVRCVHVHETYHTVDREY